MKIGTLKGKDCPYKPITCQEGYCYDCQIYRNHIEYPGAMGQELEAHEKLEADKMAKLKVMVEEKRDDVFAEAGCGSPVVREVMLSMKSAYDVVLNLIKEVSNG